MSKKTAFQKSIESLPKDKEQLIETFKSLSPSQRHALAKEMNDIASVLWYDYNFEPTVCEGYIKIPVSDWEQGMALQRKLIALGCGFHNGSRLVQEVCNAVVHGIFVNPKGNISLVLPDAASQKHYEESDRIEIQPEIILAASNLLDIVSSTKKKSPRP